MEFKWLNEGEIVKKDNRIEIKAPAHTPMILHPSWS